MTQQAALSSPTDGTKKLLTDTASNKHPKICAFINPYKTNIHLLYKFILNILTTQNNEHKFTKKFLTILLPLHSLR
jgi:hypothetical protein